MHFINDNSVAIVPVKWIVNVNFCYWPPYRGSRLENSIQKKEEPKLSWEQLPARSLHLYGILPKDLHVILSRLASIETKQAMHSQILNSILNAVTQHKSYDTLPEGINLPLDCIQELKDFDEKLKENSTFKLLVNHLAQIGGRNIGDTTRRLLRTLFSKGLSLQLNFADKGWKSWNRQHENNFSYCQCC
ncbi:uncharacterized protein LOC105848704 [Hydra vulgaris]|uniref:uncharacterized protein LOC105848704 n=1 Tax=Hydra vulgaris TaxID=6087 RepID=UPI001F5E799B|nr:uncharacterized protein LOC105848704 [Hydra vulgaris]